MDVRPYVPTDRDACLAVFDSNAPEFFLAHERAEFESFLDTPNGPYFVLDHDGLITGCGGYVVGEEPGLARMAWGMVLRDWHRKGMGRLLLMYRLRQITKAGGVQFVGLDTTQRSAPFFLSQGFKVAGVAADGYGPGMDRVEMTMKLNVCP